MANPVFIAEIKTKSPYGFQSEHSFFKLMDYAIGYGDWVSVHTNALWGGDFESIAFVRRCTNKPILAKGLHATDDDVKRAFDHGADYVLVVDRYPIFEMRDIKQYEKVLLEYGRVGEAHWLSKTKLAEAKRLLGIDLKIVHNSRDLRTGLPARTTLEEYLELGAWTCQASNIKTFEDVNDKVDAFIVGEHLINFCKQI